MFAWANKTLANLAETIAPPASDSTHKFLAACSAQDEHGAMACLTNPMGDDLPPLDPHGVVNPNKGTQPIHVACQYGLIDLVKTLITQYRVSPDAFDSGGNTPLHHAAMYSDGSPRHLDLVKILVGEFNASVVVKNSEGKSPYDVATGANVRNYLLPIQLQRETQACLDDGGRGLAPGIDLGGMKINYSNHGAPPMAPGGGAPGVPPPPHPGTPGVGAPAPSSGGLPQAGATGGPPSPYMAPPMGAATGAGESTPMSPATAASGDAAAAAATATSGPPPPPHPTADPASGAAAGPASGAPPTPAQAGPPAPPPPPAAPPSGGGGARTYARHSSAPTSGNMKYRPDGFHSSSSDVALQEKYGHAKVDYSHIPPPPMSGGGGAGMPPPPGSGGGSGAAAPSSGGMPPPPYYGGGGGYSAVPTARAGSRYPVYDAVTDTHSLPPPPPGAPAGGQPTPSPAPTPPAYSVFQPTATAGAGAQVHTQQPPAQQPPPHSGGYSAQPPPQQQQPPHSGGYSAQPQHQQPIYSPPPVGTIPTTGVAVQHSFNQQAPPQPQHQPTSPSAEEEDSFVS